MRRPIPSRRERFTDDDLMNALISVNETLLALPRSGLDEVEVYKGFCLALSGPRFGVAIFVRNGDRVELLCSSPSVPAELLLAPSTRDAVHRAIGGELVRLDPAPGDVGSSEAALTRVAVDGEPVSVVLVHTKELSLKAVPLARLTAQHLSFIISTFRELRLKDLLLDSLPAYVYLKDDKFNFVYWNRFFEDNIAFENPSGRKCYEVSKGLSRPCYGCPSLKALGKAGTEKHEWTSRSGRTYMNIHRSVEFGGKTFFISTGVDITELKETEESLKRAMRDLQALYFIINRSPAVTFLWKNEEGWPVEYVTENISKFGYSPDDFTSGRLKYADIVSPEDLARVASEVSEYSKKGLVEFEQVYRIVTRDGQTRWVRDYTWVRRSPSGEITHYQGIILDITETVLAREALWNYVSSLEEVVVERTKRLREAERMAALGEAATMVGHDLRNPLQAMTNLVWLTREEISRLGINDERERQTLLEIYGRVQRQIQYMDKIVRDLNDYARSVSPQYEPVNIQEVVKDALSSVSIPPNVDVQVSVETALSCVKTDPYLLKRCLVNILTNAVQAMPRGGQLRVEAAVEEGGHRYAVSVSDTGVGIPPEVREKLFQPFVTGKPRGMGMGLAVVKKFVEAMGGSVEVESRPEVAGTAAVKGEEGRTTFTIRLPLTRERTT
ncbi:MAG: ATP-binding protein [Candidatus Verstraetearchaeota archaeon]|nr:ATP-binding protein [Candidatus Verstraetearchaeota archaeon]